ncbi:MAG: hypothetical protein ACXWMK_07710, partial [Syntrophales bacterium]
MKRDKRRPHIKISLCMTIAFIFFFISGHSGGIGYKGADASSALAAETDVNQPSSSALAQEQCSALSAQQLVYRASVATTVTQLTSKLRVLPGGDVAKVEIPAIAPGNSVYCAKFIEGNATVRVITAISTGGQKTDLTLGMPDIGFGRQQQKEIVLVSFPVDPKGQLKIDSPGVSVRQMVRVSDRLFSFFIALIFVVLAYVIAVVLQGRVGNKTWCIDPVYLTSGVNDKASLSQLQVFGFTLLVLGLLIFILFRTSELSDISQDILLLLGISAGGTVGSKVVGVAKKRLSSENSSWLRNHGWLTVYESGLGQSTDCKRARWGDLLKTDGSFYVYSFQLATFSVLVAFALLKIDLSALSTFSIPNNLLALLGL